MTKGKVYTYQGKKVFITDYNYLVNGRVSNWVSFCYVDDDGYLGEASGAYYNEDDFKPLKTLIKIELVGSK